LRPLKPAQSAPARTPFLQGGESNNLDHPWLGPKNEETPHRPIAEIHIAVQRRLAE
jgi:hypothetical protein